MENKLRVSLSPHIKSSNSTMRTMLDVIIALVPASIAAVILFIEIAIFFIMHPICILITVIVIAAITILIFLHSVGVL